MIQIGAPSGRRAGAFRSSSFDFMSRMTRKSHAKGFS
jgi:hypothetical protein